MSHLIHKFYGAYIIVSLALSAPVLGNETPKLIDAFNSIAAEQLIAKDISEVIFVTRNTLNADHFYTEHVNSEWMPGGNLCVLNLKTGKVRELVRIKWRSF